MEKKYLVIKEFDKEIGVFENVTDVIELPNRDVRFKESGEERLLINEGNGVYTYRLNNNMIQFNDYEVVCRRTAKNRNYFERKDDKLTEEFNK